MARPPRRSPPQEAARGSWIRAWGQREPAERANGRLNHRGATLRHRRAQGWAGLPGPSLIQLTCQSLPESVVGAPRWITRWASRTRVLRAIAASLNDDRIPVMHQPAQQGPGRSAASLRDSRPSNDAAISCRTRMGRRRDSQRPIKRPLRLPRRSVDGPTSQARNTVTRMLITIIKHSEESASEAPHNADAFVRRLANFDQPIANRRPPCPNQYRECKRPTKPAPALARALELDKELNARSAIQAELDGEQNVFRAAHQMIENAADSVISPTLPRTWANKSRFEQLIKPKRQPKK